MSVVLPAASVATSAAPREVAATPGVLRDLRAAAVRYHGTAKVTGPLEGSVRVASAGGSLWAIATFRVPKRGLAGQPDLLRRPAGSPWSVVAAVGPHLCGVPRVVLRAWGLEARARGCASPPGGLPPPPPATGD